ncbi:hypothetical protein [Bifidobacterium psychraerophilum]|uniref:hypothetical protein n=1 Tax=Bifidobacterium psychraerophilum TaxID=218140 RepID=UPI0033415FF7
MATKREKFEDYTGFVDKFKARTKLTTDDCYTPPAVFKAVTEWAVHEYGLDARALVRPFWPGGDYESYEYPDGCVVLDNPPFSILASITRHYAERGIDYFLFCPYLTALSNRTEGCNHIITDAKIVYHNGAVVNTSFLTNLGDDFIRTAPGLALAIAKAMAKDGPPARTLPHYEYPPEVLTATMVGRIGRQGADFRVRREQCRRVTRLDAQPKGKGIFGSGYLISQQLAARKTALQQDAARRDDTIRFELSERERGIVAEISV